MAAHDALVSTNDEALQRARSGDPGRLWITAARQSGGRGRNGRVWTSEPGNLFASLLLIDPAPPARAAELGFVTSLALALALRQILGDDPALRIKWPNDILYDGAKLAGILLESVALPHDFACVAGIGVNCGSHPEGTLYPATDLATAAGREIAPAAVFEALASAMARQLDLWSNGAGFATIRAEWLALAAGVGAPIKIARPNETIEGVFETIDGTGRLILRQESGERAIDAGDVFLAAPPPRAHL
ncbi:biotin--[acetyl-CoA-carboxylase] ligase [Methylocella sp.]|uniref:biotin--[acetyl-CoA-carboxylase] ligase n=1 Tax=Methylocella sp. TaxID=1978226 RepID=UPI003C16659C